MSPSVSCQGKEFLFANACCKCDRCFQEATAVVEKWRLTPMCSIPAHIVICILQAEVILGPEQFVKTIRGENGPSN